MDLHLTVFYEAVITSSCSAQLLDKCVGISQAPGAPEGVAQCYLSLSSRHAHGRRPFPGMRPLRRGRRGCSSRVWSPSFPSKPELYSSLARSHAPPGSASTAHLTRATSRPQAIRAPRPHPPQDACHFTGSLPQLDCNLEVRGHQDTRLSVSRAEWKHGWYSGTSLTATTENDKYRRYPRKKKSIT